jgi:hypothetical protein
MSLFVKIKHVLAEHVTVRTSLVEVGIYLDLSFVILKCKQNFFLKSTSITFATNYRCISMGLHCVDAPFLVALPEIRALVTQDYGALAVTEVSEVVVAGLDVLHRLGRLMLRTAFL